MGIPKMVSGWVGAITVCIAVLTASACAGSNDATSEPPGDEQGIASDTGSDASVESDGATSATADGPLGFDSAVFTLPDPPGADDPGTSSSASDLIAAGVESGAWTEADGVRALVSVLMGELSSSSVPAVRQLDEPNYREVVLRAIALADDPSVDDATRADLARLTSFFTASELTLVPAGGEEIEGDEEAAPPGDDENSAPMLVSLGAPLAQAQTCETVREVHTYEAQATRTCYFKFASGDDVLFLPHDSDTDIVDTVFAMIDAARAGFTGLSGRELQPIDVLFSPVISPDDRASGSIGDAAAVAQLNNNNASRCRVAVFVAETIQDDLRELTFTITHELWHCIQALWDSDDGAKSLTAEGGADYFAYEVLGQQCQGAASGAGLDLGTTTGSLLDREYDGWYFWAFLAEHGHLSPQQISAAHESIGGGTSVEDTLQAVISNLPQVVNEFYVRMVGPGLACDFKGSATTNTITIDKQGPVELEAALWEGKRYRVMYANGKLYEQTDDGAGAMGMAEFAVRGSASEWVVSEPEIRSTCDEDAEWIVVVNSPTDEPTSPRVLQIDRVATGDCDPCLIGSWSIDLATFATYVETLSDGQRITMSGSWIYTFLPGPPDGSSEFFDQRDILMMFPGIDASRGITRAGSGTGTYSTSASTLTVSNYADQGTISVVGFESPFATMGDGSAIYSCEDDDMTISIRGVAVQATRVPATRQGVPYFG